MSLFKVLDVWSLDLEELQRHSSDPRHSPSAGDIECKAQFIVHPGRFACVGDQDVFVCGDLRGRIYLIQVPDSDQRKHIRSRRDERPATSASVSSSGSSNRTNFGQTQEANPSAFSTSERQILAAHNLGTPVVDLKCGFFTSALKQSIAVLTYDELVILQVKTHKVDLMSTPNIGESKTGTTNQLVDLDKNLMSHEFEIDIKLDLLPGQFAYNLLVLTSHADSSLVDFDSSGAQNLFDLDSKSAAKEANKFKRTSKQIVQQLHLPQRDKIIVQYTDQFLFTLVDSKKIVGHFCVRPPPTPPMRPPGREQSAQEAEELAEELELEQQEHTFGCMPAAFVAASSKAAASLAVTFSDYSVHLLPLDKLTSQAKQNVMKRVALDLLGAKVNLAPGKSTLSSGGGSSGDHKDPLIQVNLEATAEWSHELLGLPLAMQGVRRQLKTTGNGLGRSGNKDSTGQLLVMSRYSLDLFSSTGAHLWSQRFEDPLLCMHAYTTTSSEPTTNELAASQLAAPPKVATAQGEKTDTAQYEDKIITLLCSDNLSDDRCNLIITSDDRTCWSAVLHSKPLQIWRLNLTHMPGFLATLDLMSGQLAASYLGTNMDSPEQLALEMQEDGAESDEEAAANDLVQLERLDDTMADESSDGEEGSSKRSAGDDLRARLRVHNSLEATDSSDGSVQVCTSIQLNPDAAGVVLHNITITFEFDDLLRFEADDGVRNVSHPAPGTAQIRLGSCWPDRREPIKLNTTFSLARSSPTSNTKSFGENRGCDDLDGVGMTAVNPESDSRLLPKSLKVNQLLDFNETHSGPLHQQAAFLLPICLVARLTHIDYSSGQGQELDDVLGNLNQYVRADGTTPPLYCDLFLKLRCDLITLLGAIIDGDLMCWEPFMRGTINSEQKTTMKRIETLENINLLAQSLNCRLRFMSPTLGISRQASEDPTQPVMVSLALRLKANNLRAPGDANQDTDEQIVWIHICDLTRANRSKIVEDFIDRHSKGWKRYEATTSGDIGGTSESGEDTPRALLSIECDQALPVVLVLDHLIERVRHLSWFDAQLGTNVISARHSIDPMTDYNRVAVSQSFHDSLATLVSIYNSEHQERFKQLQSEMVMEYCKFQVVAKTSLSLAKRLPSLPDEMSSQVTCMIELVKHYHQNLSNVLGELERLKRLDYEYSKLPYARVLEIESTHVPNRTLWSGFDPIID